MSEHVWVSNVLADSELMLMVGTDIAEQRKDDAIAGIKLLNQGEAVPATLCPRQVWLDKGRSRKTMPKLFLASSFPIVSEAAASVLRRFDLGDGALHPIEGVLASDRTTRMPGAFQCWTFGNRKTAFAPDASPAKRTFGIGGTKWNMPFVMKDDQLKVSAAALDGPDVWMDPTLFKAVFLSGPLGDALAAAGLTKALRAYRCPVA